MQTPSEATRSDPKRAHLREVGRVDPAERLLHRGAHVLVGVGEALDERQAADLEEERLVTLADEPEQLRASGDMRPT